MLFRSLLGLSNPIGILFSALFIANITVGGFNLQQYNFVPEVINIITASIIYFSAFALMFKSFLGKIILKRQREDGETAEDVTVGILDPGKSDKGSPQPPPEGSNTL